MPAITNATLRPWLEASPFQGYAYAYPHKTAYRPLQPAMPFSEVWAQEDRRQLFLYLHVPFCEMRCGFCNLFTTANPEAGLVVRWLDAMLAEARTMRDVLGDGSQFARGAIGGGTPTFLSEHELTRLLGGVRELFGDGLRATPFSVEMSPATVSAEKLALLREFGMQRAS
ncbi:MAG: coproporphyrinogen III oxidase family protein, partial [Verrucomicrobiota bacterium]